MENGRQFVQKGLYVRLNRFIFMYHFFVNPSCIQEKKAVIEGADARHISKVLRMREGEKLIINTGDDWEYLCVIEKIQKDRVYLEIKEENEDVRELPNRIVLFQALPKLDKMDFIIQKAVELGVSEIVPVITNRVVVKLDAKKTLQRFERWNAIAKSAAQQSKRNIIPYVNKSLDFKNVLEYTKDFKHKLIPYELERRKGRLDIFLKKISADEDIAVFIGPEGGFEESEVEAAIDAGFNSLMLGKRILRTETAGLAVLSAIMLYLDA